METMLLYNYFNISRCGKEIADFYDKQGVMNGEQIIH